MEGEGGDLYMHSPPHVLLELFPKAFEDADVVVAALRLAVINLWQYGHNAQLMTFAVVLQHTGTGYLHHRTDMVTANRR